MKPVMQRERSDCLRACLASIFEVPWEEAPDTGFDDGRGEHDLAVQQMTLVSDWLAARGLAEWDLNMEADPPVLRRGIRHFADGTTEPADWLYPYPWVGHYIGSGVSSRGVSHAVVMLHGEIVHDPHPSQDMTIDRIDTIHVFVARDPEPDKYRIPPGDTPAQERLRDLWRDAALHAAITEARRQQDAFLRDRFDIVEPELTAEIKPIADRAADAAVAKVQIDFARRLKDCESNADVVALAYSWNRELVALLPLRGRERS